jgi:acetylornithine aminotransferase
MPIGACLVAGHAVGVLQAGNHGSTFGGNPLACRAALAVLETIENEAMLNHVQDLSKQMLQGFKAKLSDLTGVKDIRGLGFMLGIELNVSCGELVKQALAQGLLINVTADSVIRLLPPLVINAEEAEMIVNKVSELVINFLSSHAVESVA